MDMMGLDTEVVLETAVMGLDTDVMGLDTAVGLETAVLGPDPMDSSCCNSELCLAALKNPERNYWKWLKRGHVAPDTFLLMTRFKCNFKGF